jgi:hypothetical protein
MTTPLPELLAQVETLNDPASAFVFHVDGDRIVGAWDIAHVEYVELEDAGRADEVYRIDVEFQPEDETYALEEQQKSSEFDASRVKASLITFLESHGWGKRKSFFGRLFS